MIKNNKIKLIISSLIVILPIFIGLVLWNQLPEQIVTHWSFGGTPDGWSSKAFTVLGLPLILLAIHLVCLFITFLDPKNEMQTKSVFNLVIWITPIVSIFSNGAIYLGAFNIDVPTQIIGSLFTALLFIVLGIYLPKCKQNYTIGIKIPSTLNDEANWNATHKFSGKLWILGGILMLTCGFLPENICLWTFFGIIFIITLIPFIYSYVYYKKTNNK
jgi:uncharacterized membrane protein